MCSLSPKQKAEDLIIKFKNSENNYGLLNVRDIYASISCALITVDEMIAQCEDANFGGFSLYWGSVKQELLNFQNNV